MDHQRSERIINIGEVSVPFLCERDGKTKVSHIVHMFTVNLIVQRHISVQPYYVMHTLTVCFLLDIKHERQ